MTENEVKNKLEVLKEWVGDASLTRKDMQSVIDEAIQALEEIQQYRAMEEKLNGISVAQVVGGFINTIEKGTAEEYMRGRILTNRETDMWDEYRAIGTIEEFKALKEKKPKKKKSNKVIFTHDSYAYCPHCKTPVQLWNRICEKCCGELDWH